MDPAQTVIEILVQMFQEKGYVTEDEVFNACEFHDLDLGKIDYVSNQLLDRGVLIGDPPSSDEEKSVESAFDYSQTDYKAIFRYFRKHYPGMKPIIKQIQKTIPPQKKEMEQLLLQTRSGNQHTREILIRKNMRIALKMAYSYRDKTTIPLEDLFSVAIIGIIKAIEAYDPFKHSYFTSYCGTWMMQSVDRYICDHEALIRIPVHMYEKVKQIRQWREECSKKELFTRIQNSFKVDELEMLDLISYSEIENMQSLDQLLKKWPDLQLYDSFDVNNNIDSKLFKEQFHDALSKLTEREQTIIMMRNGLNGNRTMTLEEVGKHLSLTRERVRQIESCAIKKLRRSPKLRLLFKTSKGGQL